MKSPLEIYKEILKEYGIEGELDDHPRRKLAYVEEQIQQQRSILIRLLFDSTIATSAMNEAKDKLSKDAHRQKVDKYQNDIYQIVEGLKRHIQIAQELRKEYAKELSNDEAGSSPTF